LLKYGGGLIPSFFYDMIDAERIFFMDKEKLKLIVRNLELLVDSLKSEIYSDSSSSYTGVEMKKRPILDYDEIFDDDEYEN